MTDEDEVRRWYAGERTGLGIVCGEVSGGLELFEFEGRAVESGVAREFVRAARALGLGDLLDRVRRGYRERTPSGGVHFLYRCVSPESKKLASAADNKPLIETKGEGGYVVTAPSHGSVHPSGRPWVLEAGGWATIPTLTPEERNALHVLATTFDERTPKEIQAPAGLSV